MDDELLQDASEKDQIEVTNLVLLVRERTSRMADLARALIEEQREAEREMHAIQRDYLYKLDDAWGAVSALCGWDDYEEALEPLTVDVRFVDA